MTNNEIKLTINISDDLLNKFMTAMVKMNSMQAMGAMGLPMISTDWHAAISWEL